MALSSFSRAFQSTTTRKSQSPMGLFAQKSTKTAIKRAGKFWEARMDGFRPTVNDVERISWGKPAKIKGTGSRGVPHRLNGEERLLFDQARRKGFLEVAGSGWRPQRRDAPLLNTYRSLCDARGQASVILRKDKTGVDELVVDISPLRYEGSFGDIAQECLKQQPDGEVIFEFSGIESNEPKRNEGGTDQERKEESPWSIRPIYQLPPYCIVWRLPRAEAKAVGKKMAEIFDTVEGKSGPSKKPIGVKPGKGRLHGGYGIG
jgi:hypothetical protein